MYTPILYSFHPCFSSDITGKNLTFPTPDSFIQANVSNWSWSGKNTQCLTDHFFPAIPMLKTAVAQAKPFSDLQILN
ncbi:hypothetical protein [Nitrosomonas sp. Nm33]|uniref:hypothetical protein n=1 Tax=Nitrosomonas sp. Nm33 TaxID=133724 RepID=UPI00089A90AE|nr:hypothetical protein [Nitrosomonas sp. Nm33]SDY77799.1 hypothetical protein SAMN05421755_10487 [Nitrosomonas sp. Nm33]